MLALVDLKAREDNIVNTIITTYNTLVATIKRVNTIVRTTKAIIKEIRPKNI